MRFTVKSPISLKSFLKEQFPDTSNNTLQSWIKTGRICVDGCIVTHFDHPLKEGQSVLFSKKESILPLGIKILYEDNHIVVIYKPEGVLSVATDTEPNKTAHGVLKRRFKSQMVFPVHRLDRETSGVMMFAYTREAQEKLKEFFEKKEISREYVAVIHGKPASLSGTVKSHLIELITLHVISTEDTTRGKLAITHYEVIGGCKGFSLVRLKLETGRKNQIRVHMSEMGHPIVGDDKYDSSFKKSRMYLHAYYLSFKHPISNKEMSFSSPIPSSFIQLSKAELTQINSKLKLTI